MATDSPGRLHVRRLEQGLAGRASMAREGAGAPAAVDDLGPERLTELLKDWCRTGRYLDDKLRRHGGVILIRRAPGGLVLTHRRKPIDEPREEEHIAYCRDDLVPWGTGTP